MNVWHGILQSKETNSICELVILTEQLLSALKGDETCVSTNVSH